MVIGRKVRNTPNLMIDNHTIISKMVTDYKYLRTNINIIQII